MDHMLPRSLDGVHIFFPDPWHKKKHNKRRLIQPRWWPSWPHASSPAATCTAPPTGSPTPSRCCRCWRRALLRQHGCGFAPKPDYRPLTKFENRGLRLGHGVWDLVFKRR
jgi:tRNA (guanine-N7-)-methyltransferase